MFALLLAFAFVTPPNTPEVHADRIVVSKSERTMTLYAHGKQLRIYHVALGTGPGGPKQAQGDHETPEGSYIIDSRNPHSAYHLSLHISYPNAHDRLMPANTVSHPAATS